MDTSNLKNIVVLKDLPSNLVEEAIVVLKENQKIENLKLVDKESKLNSSKDQENNMVLKKENKKDYIIKEAQMLISEYISKIENKNKKENQSVINLKKKCKKLKQANYFLIASLALSVVLQFFI